MSYKYSKGSTVQGDIKAADDTQRDTLIDFGEDVIDFQTSGSVRLQVNNDGVYIPDLDPGNPGPTCLRVSGGVEITPGTNAGLTFKKGESELNFISFVNESDGGSYNARLAYQSAEHLFIAPGRGADFYINSSQNSGDATFPFRIMDDGTARFEKGLTEGGTSSTSLASDIAFYVSGTTDGNNNAVFDANVVMNGATLQGAAQRVSTNPVSSFPYSVGENDYVILVEGVGSPRRIELPAKADHLGRVLIIKDATGNASSNNIEVKPNGSENIDGAGDKLINTNRGSIRIVCASDQWHIIG
jgi:hypothetical protein